MAGCSSFPRIELKEDYNFSFKQTILLYVVNSGNSELDDTYNRIFRLDLLSRGYKVFNGNNLITNNGDSVREGNHRQIADYLLSKKYMPLVNTIIIAKPVWDSVFVTTYISERKSYDKIFFTFWGQNVLRLSSEIMFFDPFNKEPVMSISAQDTSLIYAEKDIKNISYVQFPWMLVARQMSKVLKEIPICTQEIYFSAANQLKVSFWVDKSYRNIFPYEWKERIIRRVLYANDILKSQLDIELVISEFKEWNSEFDYSLDRTLYNLSVVPFNNKNQIRIGVTLNEKLKTNWTQRNNVGLSYLLGNDAVITAQPTYSELGEWNPNEEAITLVHEIGHVLGAIHVKDEKSIMYPYSGFLSYEFDDFNKQIINSTKEAFFSGNKEEQVKIYVNTLLNKKNSSSKNSIPVIKAITSAILNLSSGTPKVFPQTDRLNSFFSKVISDSVHLLAAIGYAHYKNESYEEAKRYLFRAIEIDPDFIEAHWYLGKVLRKIGEKGSAIKHEKIADAYISSWFLEE